jgi:hypothetical protein
MRVSSGLVAVLPLMLLAAVPTVRAEDQPAKVETKEAAPKKAEAPKALPKLPTLITNLDADGQPCPSTFLLQDQPDHICNHGGAFTMRRVMPEVSVNNGQFGVELQMIKDLLAVMNYADPAAGGDPSIGIYGRSRDGGFKEVSRAIPKDRTRLDFFGGAMGVTENFIVAGAAHSDGVTAENTQDALQGRVYVFKRKTGLRPSWEETQVLVPSRHVNQYNFGVSLALGEKWLAVGSNQKKADEKATSSGVALYKLDEAKQLWTEVSNLSAPDGVPARQFGDKLAIQGDKLFVAAPDTYGANKEFSGAVLIYDLSKPDFPQIGRIDAPEGRNGTGFAQSLEVNGNQVAVGAITDSVQGKRSGAVYLYAQQGDGTWTLSNRIVPNNGGDDDGFGGNIRLENNRMLVSAASKDGIGSSQYDMGAVYLFDRPAAGAKWQQKAMFIANDVAKDMRFGRSMAFAGDEVIMGAPTNSSQIYYGGAIYVVKPNKR